MSNAVRVTTWRAMFAAFGVDPETADEGARRVCHDAALNYARACGYKPPETGPQRVATGAHSAVAGDGMVMPFGRDKSKRLADLDERSLLWWKAVYERDVADEAKAAYLARNQAALDAVNERLADFRRGEP